MGLSYKGRLLVLVAATGIVAASCIGTEPSAPLADRRSPDETSSALGGIVGATDTTTTVFTVDPTVTSTYQIASTHRLWIQAGGICTLDSPYGAGMWDTACQILTTPIVITAKSWYDNGNHPHVEFSPALRFAPLDAKRASAELYLKDKSGSVDPAAVILYCGATGCVDEAATDSSLITMRDRQQGFLYRRIKHFSGYEVSTGRSDDSTDAGVIQQ